MDKKNSNWSANNAKKQLNSMHKLSTYFLCKHFFNAHYKIKMNNCITYYDKICKFWEII